MNLRFHLSSREPYQYIKGIKGKKRKEEKKGARNFKKDRDRHNLVEFSDCKVPTK